MESSRKHRGIRGKLTKSLNRGAKASVVQYDQLVMATPMKAKINMESNVKIENRTELVFSNENETSGYISEVDRRAASYISCVQERFRAERGEEEYWRKYNY